ncbi:MAG TPA: hypothetical protein VFA83_04590 [Acidimicrobiales bacterium]|nr:hypothetical protein [Acidimicrobiales bacterium]
MRRVIAIVAIGVALVATSACSLGEKQAMTNRVIRAAALVGANGGVVATMVVDVKVIPSKLPIAPGPPKIVSNTANGISAVLDFKTSRAAVAFPAADPAQAAMVFIGSRVYQRTGIKAPAVQTPSAGLAAIASGAAPANGVSGLQASATGRAGIDSNIGALAASTVPVPTTTPAGAPSQPSPSTSSTLPVLTLPTTTSTTSTTAPASESRLHRPVRIQRQWIAFDYSSLPKRDKTKAAGSFAISPIVFERLILGTLTGSIRQQGTETIDGVQTVHSTMNVSRDKIERHLPDRVRQDLDKMFRANAIGGQVFHAETWVDTGGRLRRFTVRMRQTLSRIDRADLTVTVDLAPADSPVAVPTPDPKTTAVVNQLGQLIHGAVTA